jgi:hypothetical protein
VGDVALIASGGQSWNLVGPPVWFLLGLGLAGAFCVSRISPLRPRVRFGVLPYLPVVMLIGCVFTRWLRAGSHSFLGAWYFYKSYYAELDIAFILSFAFGVAFTIGVLRCHERRTRIVGWVCFVPTYGLLLVAILAYLSQWYRT